LIRPGQYKRDPAGWAICVKGPKKGFAVNHGTGQEMRLLDFIAWIYDVSYEEAYLECMATLAKNRS